MTSSSALDDEILMQIFFTEDSEDDDIDDDPDGANSSKRNRTDFKRGAKRPKLGDPWETNSWLRLIRNPLVRNPREREGKEFRRKFRVPFPTFEKIVEMCKNTGEKAFNTPPTDICGFTCIPIELKILAVLRVFADGLSFHTGSELANWLSENTLNSFFKLFNSLFRKHFQNVLIKDMSGEQLIRAMRDYIRLGLPGAVGSIDATFVPWDRCPAELHNLCDGDKGVGLLFNVVVTHTREVVSVSNGFYATINDKTSVKYDDFIQKLKDGKIGEGYSYIMYIPSDNDAGFEELDLSEFYVIADGGYIDIPQIIRGFERSGDSVKYKFSDWIASVRKDVECFFGILKERFRFLKRPVTLQKKEDIDNAFVTACLLHNMILNQDGLDTLWESEVNWKTLNPKGEAEVADDSSELDDVYHPIFHDSTTFVPRHIADLIPEERIDFRNPEKQKFEKLQMLLANHMQLMYKQGKLRWPKQRSQIAKEFNEDPRREFPDTGDLED